MDDPTREKNILKAGLQPGALAGQVAVITGAGRGIGRETARIFAYLGAAVVIAEIDHQGQELERQICRSGGKALFVQTDVSQPDSVAHLAMQARANFGSVDILVNNAILCPAVRVVDMDLDQWETVIGVNLRGAFMTCKSFLPDMIRSGKGTIVNMVSTDAMPGLAAYIASKKGLTGFSQSLAAEVGAQGVRVIALAPGMVDTPGLRGVAEGLAPNLGMKAEEFLSVSMHPAYPGLMPAEHAGLATACLVVHLAGEYHGEVVTGYEVLERCGVISPPGDSLATAETVAHRPGSSTGFDVQAALRLLDQLLAVIAETEAEFNRLPVFVRPMARSGFKSKAGKSLQDWRRSLAGITDDLRAGERGNTDASQAGRARLAGLQVDLGKLVEYYRGVPRETSRFTRDEETLRMVTQVSQERVALIHALQAVLDSL